MRNTSIRCALGGAACLLAGLLAGCSDEGASPTSSTSGPGKRPATAAAADSGVKPAAVANSTAAKLPVSAPAKTVAKGNGETVAIGACDGGGAVEVPKTLTGQPLADSLMDDWKRNHPEVEWVARTKKSGTRSNRPPTTPDLLKGGQAKGDTYGNFTPKRP